MKMAKGGSNICVPCSETPRGKQQCESATAYDKRIFGDGQRRELTDARSDVQFERVA